MTKPLIVFQSDDWGSQRIPRNVDSRIKLDYQNEFIQYDTLEDHTDLEYLMDAIESLNVQFTLNIVSGNPHFEKIKENNFQEYYVKDLNQSYLYYGFNQNLINEQWIKISNSNRFDLQFHSREHVNSTLWLKALQNNDSLANAAFDLGFWGLSTEYTKKNKKSFMATWDENPNDTHQLNFVEGLKLFQDYFKIQPVSFAPNNYIFPIGNLDFLESSGIKSMQGREYLIQPQWSNIFKYRKKIPRKTGQKEKGSKNLISIVRNVQFEPSKDLFSLQQNRLFTPQIESASKQIETSIKQGLPVVIDTHRVNYVGGISEKNREYGFAQLKELVGRIKNNYPDSEYISTSELTNRLNAIYQ